jgi:predicted dehydrogenase
VAAQKKYGKLVQVGDQQRSSDYTIKMIQKIHDGLHRRRIHGQVLVRQHARRHGLRQARARARHAQLGSVAGPAPRSEYKDNIHPYNWHWLRRYGTGETLNNGTHEVDVCRWALRRRFPHAVTASGGNYQFKDDWEFYDTLITNFEYEGKTISWEGRSRQGMRSTIATAAR